MGGKNSKYAEVNTPKLSDKVDGRTRGQPQAASTDSQIRVWYRHSGQPEISQVPRTRDIEVKVFESTKEIEVEIGNHDITHMYIWTGDIPTLIATAPHLTQLKIWNVTDISQLYSLRSLKHLDVLDLSDSNFSHGLPDVITELRTLTQLYVNSCKLTDLPRRLRFLTQLKVLSLKYNNFAKGLPNVVSQLVTLEQLYLERCMLTGLPQSLSHLSQLTLLKLSGNDFYKKTPSVIGELTSLRELYLGYCEITDLPQNLSNLTQLTVLGTNSSDFSKGLPSVVGQLVSLKQLCMQGCQLKRLPQSLSALTSLEFLKLKKNTFSDGFPPVLEDLENLREVDLDSCMLADLPESLCKNEQLKVLHLRDNLFKQLPPVVYKLSALESLDVAYNPKLKRIEEDIMHLSNLTKLICQCSEQLEYPPYAVCQQGLPAVRAYFTDLNAAAGADMAAIPVAIVGNPLSGKTSIVRSLQEGKRNLTFRQDSSSFDEATKVFKIEDLSLQNAHVKLIDYGGHEVYHLAYQLIIQERCLPFIVVNMKEFADLMSSRGPKEATKRVCFDWMSHLYLACPNLGAPILALTHIDQLKADHFQEIKQKFLQTAEIIRAELLEEEGQSSLTDIPYLANKERPLFKDEDIFCFSNNMEETSNITSLKNKIDLRCTEFSVVIPRSWALIAEFIDEQTVQPYLMLSDIQAKFQSVDCHIVLRYMHNAGKIFWFEHQSGLSEYIFHCISAITDMIALLFHHSSDKMWKEHLDSFASFSHEGERIGKHKCEVFIEKLLQTGVLDEALLFHLLQNRSQFPFEIALKLLQCFYIVHGPINNELRTTYIVPYLTDNFMDSSWKTDGHVQLRLDLVLGGLSLPKYVYQLMTVVVLNENSEQFDSVVVAKNGATVLHEDCATHFVHDYNSRKVTLQVSTNTDMLGSSWKRLAMTAKKVLQLLLNVWKASHVEVLVYCAHCLFLRDPNPAYDVDPAWFQSASDVTAMTIYAGIELLACRRCSSSTKVMKRTVPKPLKLPCCQLNKDEVKELNSYLSGIEADRYSFYPEPEDVVDESSNTADNDDVDSDLSDVEEKGYCSHSSKVGMSLALSPVRKGKVKKLYHNTEKVYQMSDRVRGRVLIININFFPDIDERRFGSQADYDNISRLFRDLRFDIAKSEKELTDLSAQEIYTEIGEETKRDEHTALGMFVLVLMSHGTRGDVILDTRCQPVDLVSIKDLLSARNFPAMKGKPKLIIVQACSGALPDLGDSRQRSEVTAAADTNTSTADTVRPDSAKAADQPITFNADDFFVMKASSEPYLATRSVSHGSWFIRVLVATFYRHSSHRDVESLFKIVQERVRKVSLRENTEIGGNVPTSVCTFTNYRKLYFFPGFPAR